MPDGMAGPFEGKYSWKMPSDVRMEVGPTIIHPLPRNYVGATRKYARFVRVVELPDGGLSLESYHGGIPFPKFLRATQRMEETGQRLVSVHFQ
jgi:hypothetical protein